MTDLRPALADLVTSGVLDRLARAIGHAIADGMHQHQADLEQAELEAAKAADPLARAADTVLASLEPWAREAARTPRAPGSPTAVLLKHAIAYLAALQEANRSGGPAS